MFSLLVYIFLQVPRALERRYRLKPIFLQCPLVIEFYTVKVLLLPPAKIFALSTRHAHPTHDGRTIGHAITDYDAVMFHGLDVVDSSASPLVPRFSDFFPRGTKNFNLAVHTIEFSPQEPADMVVVAGAAKVENPGIVAGPDLRGLPGLDEVELTHKRKVDELE